jgi:esterase/lipase
MEMISYQEAKKEFVVTVPERPEINYARLPIAGLRQMGRFMRELEPKLAKISVPVQVLQADGDPVVDPAGSRRLFEMLGSQQKSYQMFPLLRHGILAGPGSEEVHAAIGAFVDGLSGGPPET